MDKTTQFQIIDQAFLPAREIEIPELFSGRKDEIIQGLHALRSQGASICIYGRRGVGKSSVAKQLRLVASGYSALTDFIGHPELFDPDLFYFPTVYFYCDDTIEGPNDLFRKLLADRDALNGICRYNDGIILKKTKTKKSQTAKLTYKLLEAAATEEHETEDIFAELDPVSAFKSVTAEIVDSASTNSIVVVIDEFERVSSKVGIASIIRTCPHVKFILVGVSEDIRLLISDHESIRRQLVEGTIKVNPMTDEMLVEILKRAEAIMREIKFDQSVIANIVELANGYPHWVHLMGRWSCIDVVEQGSGTVRMENLQRALDRIVKNEPIYEDAYMEVTAGLKENELMLRILALESEEKLNPEAKFEVSKNYGVSYARWKTYIDRLIELNVLNEVKNQFTSFTDMRFKIYCRIKPPLYPENSNKNLTLQERYYEAAVSIDDLGLAVATDTGIANYNIPSAYFKASQYAPIKWDFVINEEKPLLYDSSGKAIKKDTGYLFGKIKSPRRRR